MEYLFITEEDKEDAITRALYGREQEHLGYELNRQNYEAILASLGDIGPWPPELDKYQTVFGEALAKKDLSAADLTRVAALQYRDRIALLLKTEIMERDKGVKVYEALKARLPADPQKKQAALDRALAHFAALKAAQATKGG